MRARGVFKSFGVLSGIVALSLIVAGGAMACTAMMVGKGATVDGSSMVSHTADGWYDQRIQIVPGKKWGAGSTASVYKNLCYQTIPTKKLIEVGTIPQVEETYTYFNVGYPFMNEHKLMIGEATWGGREELYCDNGWMMIEMLEVFALQRARTAREAVKVMGELAEKYGYGDAGEGLCLSDGNEVWLFEIAGPGPLWTPESGKPGAVWVAARIPDNHVSVIANRSRIGAVDFDDPDKYMWSENVRSFAKEMGWWKDGETFEFNRAYMPAEDNAYLPVCSRREWRVLSLLAPSLKLSSTAAQYPLSVKPDKKVSVQDLIAINRDHYQGTPYDLGKTKAGGPFECPVVYRPNMDQRPKGMEHVYWERNISIFRCSYSHVAQSWADRPDPVGGILWFGEDQPLTTVYVPIFCGVTEVPKSWATGTRHKMDRESAWWAFNFVSNWATLKWNYIIKDIQAEQERFESRFFKEIPDVSSKAMDMYKKNPKKAVALVTEYTDKAMVEVEKAWWALGDALVGKYCDGYVMTEEGTQEGVGYPTWWLEDVGYGALSNPADPK
ncbi:MAG: peptidase C69 [Dethiosulfovibrio peptidovorans]|nr:MAG: peptidase C69 [Dethiosulfovibrio peptidovorans]